MNSIKTSYCVHRGLSASIYEYIYIEKKKFPKILSLVERSICKCNKKIYLTVNTKKACSLHIVNFYQASSKLIAGLLKVRLPLAYRKPSHKNPG